MRHLGLASLILALAAPPAFADVKAGLDAWARGDYAAAVAEWRRLAERGDADAQFNLGQAYRLGRGVPQDFLAAEEWYRRAALQNHRQAADNYGLALFQNGRRRDAVPWLEASAGRGEPRAQYVLGSMYFNGDVIAKDHARAYALLTGASAAGIPRAAEVLAQVDRFISPADKVRGKAMAEQLPGRPPPAEVAAAPAPQSGRPTPVPVGIEELPPSHAAAAATPAGGERPAVADAAPPSPAPLSPTSVGPAPTPVPAQPASGPWRVQLGAFGNPANARRLWADVASRFPGRSPEYVPAGKLVRLLVGPYASEGAARGACVKVSPCVPVRR